MDDTIEPTIQHARPAAMDALTGLSAMAILVAAGPLGWVLEFGDNGGGGTPSPAEQTLWTLHTVLPFYLGCGLAVGMLVPRHWRLAGWTTWSVVLSGFGIGLSMLTAFDSAGDWLAWWLPKLGQGIALPIACALLGGWVGAKMRFRLARQFRNT